MCASDLVSLGGQRTQPGRFVQIEYRRVSTGWGVVIVGGIDCEVKGALRQRRYDVRGGEGAVSALTERSKIHDAHQ